MPTYTLGVSGAHTVARFERMPLAGPYDPPVNTSTLKYITGHVYDTSSTPTPVVGATVLLFRQVDNFYIGATTSGVGGVYIFPRRDDDVSEYFAIAYSLVGGVVQIHGTSDRGLVPE